MKSRSFGDLMVGVLAYMSLSGLAAIARDASPSKPSRMHSDVRWTLPVKRRRRVAEDACRVCRGNGLQPRDISLLPRLSQLWDGVR